MRLIKTEPYLPGTEKVEIIQKWGNEIPPYAILSHTWSTNPEDEVLLGDVQNRTCSQKVAFSKLANAMERARLDGYAWLWIDTCCIDKSSSVELSEAINSMYAYYRNCQTCYAFLADVHGEEAGIEFTSSRWWRRGWTLQELLAPKHVEFFNSNWQALGSRNSLKEHIWQRTTIDTIYLTGSLPIEHASIAKRRMSWQASRETTREEDIAYSMLGIFDVNMPMLYGEGAEKAFLRLQEEIMKLNEDQSLFAWVKDTDHSSTYHGLLADSPRDFIRTGHIIPYTDAGSKSKPQTLTARGLNVWLYLTPKADGTVVAALNCVIPGHGFENSLAVYLTKLTPETNRYARVECDKLASVLELGRHQEVFVRQRFSGFKPQAAYPDNYIRIRSLTSQSDGSTLPFYHISELKYPSLNSEHLSMRKAPQACEESWSSAPLVYRFDTAPGSMSVALLIKRKLDDESFLLMLGAGPTHQMGAHVCASDIFGSSDDPKATYQPQDLGKPMEIGCHNVLVYAEEQVRDNCRVWYVDINVQTSLRRPPIMEIVHQAIDALVGPNRGVARLDLRDKMKRRIKSFR